MGKSADWHLSRRQSLTCSTRRVSHKRLLQKKKAVHRELYPNTKKLRRMKSVEEKMTSNKGTALVAALVCLLGKNPFENLGELSDTESRATMHIGYNCCIPHVKPLLNQRQHQKHLTWAKKKWCLLVQVPLFR